MRRVLIISIILAAMLLSACGPATTPTPTLTPLPIEWGGVVGTGRTMTTERFTINRKPWAIQWMSNPQPHAQAEASSVFQIYVYDAKNPTIVMALAADTMEKGADTYYINETGTFYLNIDALNTYWEVTVSAE